MSVLLDFHLSDNWADPGKQRVPDAWLLPEFIDHGVTDFDIMGISYYWQWHKPTTIPQTGAIIAQLIANHPGYEVMILETGTIWTTLTNDNAGNVLNEVNPAYSPASPEYQKKWLVDLTQEVINKGGSGVVYWEPAWVSTGCSTQWGVGSHYENATFFDFDNNLLPAGGIGFMQHDYENLSAESGDIQDSGVDVLLDSSQRRLMVIFSEGVREGLYPASIVNQVGKEVFTSQIEKKGNGSSTYTLDIPALSIGIYVVVVWQGNTILERKKILFN
jgi:arabinogalactan endo-1,4-beta-galactosidase